MFFWITLEQHKIYQGETWNLCLKVTLQRNQVHQFFLLVFMHAFSLLWNSSWKDLNITDFFGTIGMFKTVQ